MDSINIAGINRSPLLIHYGAKKFVPKKFFPVKNSDWKKPKKGGLWTSPVDSKWGWKDWNDSEQYIKCDKYNSFTISLKSNAKIFVINSHEDFINAPLINGYNDTMVLDFELISKKYDAIWLTEEGEFKTRYNVKNNLYGWDCETVLVMNPNCFNVIDNI